MREINVIDSTDTFANFADAAALKTEPPGDRITTGLQGKRPTDYKYSILILNSLKFLAIKSGCIPISADFNGHQMNWLNWSLLLPKILIQHSFWLLRENANAI